MVTVKVDEKGRLMIPKRDRAALGIKPGDTFFFEREGRILRFAPAENPFVASSSDIVPRPRGTFLEAAERAAVKHRAALDELAKR